jgi:DNA sulfur modification protein DndC
MLNALAHIGIENGYGEMLPDEKTGKLKYVGNGSGKLLMLTGVRLGESAVRDQRIALSCNKNGAECGQGWFQQSTPASLADTLAPLLHWRVCHVWDWLMFNAPGYGFPTQMIADSYGGDEAVEINARTGCVGCNLASKDTALETILRIPEWAYLSPLLKLRPLYAELKRPQNRLRKDGNERRKDGALVANPMRLGPLTIEARRFGLEKVLEIQGEINLNPGRGFGPLVSLINLEELARILELQDVETWPHGWDGNEVVGDVMLDEVISEGVIQPLLSNLEK